MGWLHHGIVAMAALSSIIPQTLALPSPISSNANQRREPCAVIAQAQEEQRKKDSFALKLFVEAGLAHACLMSVPIKKQHALKLVNGLLPFLEWQSTIDYLKDPPKGYQLPGVDVEGGLKKIRDKVNRDEYPNEYTFQKELTELIASAHDGHFYVDLDLMSVFKFGRTEIGPLVSVSQDGVKLPEIFVFKDLNATVKEGAKWTPSPVKQIDGEDVIDWLQKWSYNGGQRDPDSMYSGLFYSIPKAEQDWYGNFYSVTGVYPGANTTLTFENGTTRAFTNHARTEEVFDGVVDGKSFYRQFCNYDSADERRKRRDNRRSAITTVSQREVHFEKRDEPGKSPRPHFPKAVEEFQSGAVAGYFVAGRNDAAVLSINSFVAEDKISGLQFQKFSAVVSRFLAACGKAGKSKLIIDVTGNGGGTVFLGYDVFKQLFPKTEPNDAFNLRATDQLNFVGTKVNKALLDGSGGKEVEALRGSEFDVSVYLDTHGRPRKNWEEFFGPDEVSGFKFTNLSTWNLGSKALAGSTGELTVAGYLNRANLPPPVFQPAQMVLLTDGACGSTCALMANLLRRNGVKSVVIGGRPRHAGRVEAVGGVKGTQILRLDQIRSVAIQTVDELSDNTEQERLAKTPIGEVARNGDDALSHQGGRSQPSQRRPSGR
ncbi:hypothetical protein H105_07222 [Trichophyton soudanense CBS 452.61]|uniref:Uncharacterized protein n=1 Tax=Trichophyton soudanense CBS 452.61 TaxID=1215331 RepID=A0A022XJ82_TRISD|nr:hypothetical protein H105_07222 [Trichophyton soudanense CBS 452.61]